MNKKSLLLALTLGCAGVFASSGLALAAHHGGGGGHHGGGHHGGGHHGGGHHRGHDGGVYYGGGGYYGDGDIDYDYGDYSNDSPYYYNDGYTYYNEPYVPIVPDIVYGTLGVLGIRQCQDGKYTDGYGSYDYGQGRTPTDWFYWQSVHKSYCQPY